MYSDDADSILDSLLDDVTGVSFVMVDGERASRTPSPMMAARVRGVSSGVQAMTSGVQVMKNCCRHRSFRWNRHGP